MEFINRDYTVINLSQNERAPRITTPPKSSGSEGGLPQSPPEAGNIGRIAGQQDHGIDARRIMGVVEVR